MAVAITPKRYGRDLRADSATNIEVISLVKIKTYTEELHVQQPELLES